MSDAEYLAKRKALIGKKFPVPGGTKQQGPNFLPKKPEDAPAEPSKKGVNFLNPKAVNAKREEDAGLACGGKVRKMAAGGKVRGQGCATRTKNCKTM
jgi:hypothetical protein